MITGTQKTLQNPNINLHLIFRKVYFITKKNRFTHYLSNGTLGALLGLLEAELQQLSYRANFGRFCNFLLFMSAAQVLVSAQNPPKITLHGNCCSSASIRATKVPKVPF